MLLSLVVACGANGTSGLAKDGGDTGLQQSEDTDAPVITYTQESETSAAGDDIIVEALIEDEGGGVFVANLYFRANTDLEFSSVGLIRDAADPNLYSGTIPAEEQHASNMYFYLQATDYAGNEAVLPDDAPEEYFKVRLN
jgi:hypothetical protein